MTITLDSVTKLWGRETAPAVDRVSLDVAEGEFIALLGPSGCGKSTTLRLVAGLDAPTSGRILIGGRDVTALPAEDRGIAMVFQNYALFPHLTVADNILFGLQVRRAPKAEQAERLAEAAALLGLTELLDRRPNALSGGQQQRVALGRAVVARRKVLLMDEPLSNLDAMLRQEMRQEIRALQRKLGLTVLFVTHDQAEAMSMADRIVLMKAGRVVQIDAPERLYARPAHEFAARFIGAPPMNLIPLDKGRVAGFAPPGAPAAAAWLGVRPEAMRFAEAGLLAVVEARDYLGAETLALCAAPGASGPARFSVRLAGAGAPEPGAQRAVAWAPEDQHFFAADGSRLEPAPAASSKQERTTA